MKLSLFAASLLSLSSALSFSGYSSADTVAGGESRATQSVVTSLGLIPKPNQLQVSEGAFELSAKATIGFTAGAKTEAEKLAHSLRPATGFELPLVSSTSADIVLVLDSQLADDLGEEGYQLHIDQQIQLRAATAAGLFYATQSLRQLLPAEIFATTEQALIWQLPKLKISDKPRFGWRGMHLDVSRHFMPKADVMKFIDTLSNLKINRLHWHLTDDQGWRIEIKKYPKLTEIGAWREKTKVGHQREKPHQYDGKPHGGFYTQDDIREIVAFAAERHITIVPEIDMPGHMQAAIAAYPELGVRDAWAEGETQIGPRTEWGVSPYILNAEETTVQFAQDVIAEVIELFPSEFIHIGGDEAIKRQWNASPRIQQLIKERGLHDEHELQSWFIKKMDDFIVAKGRRMIGWDEITEGGLAPNAAVMWWRSKAKNVVMAAADKGHDIVVANSKNLYFDKYQGPKDSEPLAIGGKIYLSVVYKYDPTIGLTPKQASHILGYQGQLWREYIPTTKHLEYMAFPRASALAEGTWSAAGDRNYQSYLARLPKQEQRWKHAEVNFRAQP